MLSGEVGEMSDAASGAAASPQQVNIDVRVESLRIVQPELHCHARLVVLPIAFLSHCWVGLVPQQKGL